MDWHACTHACTMSKPQDSRHTTDSNGCHQCSLAIQNTPHTPKPNPYTTPRPRPPTLEMSEGRDSCTPLVRLSTLATSRSSWAVARGRTAWLCMRATSGASGSASQSAKPHNPGPAPHHAPFGVPVPRGTQRRSRSVAPQRPAGDLRDLRRVAGATTPSGAADPAHFRLPMRPETEYDVKPARDPTYAQGRWRGQRLCRTLRRGVAR